MTPSQDVFRSMWFTRQYCQESGGMPPEDYPLSGTGLLHFLFDFAISFLLVPLIKHQNGHPQ